MIQKQCLLWSGLVCHTAKVKAKTGWHQQTEQKRERVAVKSNGKRNGHIQYGTQCVRSCYVKKRTKETDGQKWIRVKERYEASVRVSGELCCGAELEGCSSGWVAALCVDVMVEVHWTDPHTEGKAHPILNAIITRACTTKLLNSQFRLVRRGWLRGWFYNSNSAGCNSVVYINAIALNTSSFP